MKKSLFAAIFVLFMLGQQSCDKGTNPDDENLYSDKLEFCYKKCLDSNCSKYIFIVKDTFAFFEDAYPKITLKNISNKTGLKVIILNSSQDTVYTQIGYPVDTSTSHIYYFFPMVSKWVIDYTAKAYEFDNQTMRLIDSCKLYYR